jgi:uncharacterized protein YbjT (DUF2867 family)
VTVLVTGATGLIGRHVVAGLVAAGAGGVRALSRTPESARLPAGVDVVEGDLVLPDSLAAVLDGVTALHLACLVPAMEDVLARAVAAGCERVVTMSSASAPWERPAPRESRFYLRIEEAVERCGAEWVHVRPCGLMAAALDWADEVRAGVVRRGWGDSRYPHVDERDVADVAVAALLGRVRSGTRLTLTGPEAISPREQVRALGRALGRDVRFDELTPAQAIARYRADGWDDDSIEIERIVWEKGLTHPPKVRKTVQQTLSREPRTFAEWAVAHRAAFGFTP